MDLVGPSPQGQLRSEMSCSCAGAPTISLKWRLKPQALEEFVVHVFSKKEWGQACSDSSDSAQIYPQVNLDFRAIGCCCVTKVLSCILTRGKITPNGLYFQWGWRRRGKDTGYLMFSFLFCYSFPLGKTKDSRFYVTCASYRLFDSFSLGPSHALLLLSPVRDLSPYSPKPKYPPLHGCFFVFGRVLFWFPVVSFWCFWCLSICQQLAQQQ